MTKGSTKHETLGNLLGGAFVALLLTILCVVGIAPNQANGALRAVAGGSGSAVVPVATCSTAGGIIYSSAGAFTCNPGLTTTTGSNLVVSGSGTFSGVTSNAAIQLFSNTFLARATGATFYTTSGGMYGWGSSAGDNVGVNDTAIARNAAGVVEVNNGTAGILATLIASTVSSGAVVTNTLTINKTITPIGTTGSITNNSLAGSVNIATASATATVTNASVTVNSVISISLATNDATCTFKNYVPSNGSFIVNATTTCTGPASFRYAILSP